MTDGWKKEFFSVFILSFIFFSLFFNAVCQAEAFDGNNQISSPKKIFNTSSLIFLVNEHFCLDKYLIRSLVKYIRITLILKNSSRSVPFLPLLRTWTTIITIYSKFFNQFVKFIFHFPIYLIISSHHQQKH